MKEVWLSHALQPALKPTKNKAINTRPPELHPQLKLLHLLLLLQSPLIKEHHSPI